MFRCKILKYLRVAVSLAVLAWFGLFFTSFWPRSTAAAKGEFLPALLHSFHHPAVLAVAAAAGILVLTWLFGRFYCSFCCPLGVLQDIAGRVGRILSFGKLRYRCSRNWRRFRYLFAIALFALAAGGLVIPIGFFDPFTLFGRNANSLGQPALVELLREVQAENGGVIPDAALEEIAKDAFGKSYGARDLRRVIRQKVEDPVAEILLRHSGYVAKISVDVLDGALHVSEVVEVKTE